MTEGGRGTLALLRAGLRRDRLLLPVWIGLQVLMVAVSSFTMVDLYPDVASRTAAAHVINSSPALVALYGPILNEESLGELSMSKMTVVYAMVVMGLALVIVRRHTRTEEETGRADLVGATLVGRQAALRAAVLEAVLASVAVGLLAAAANAGAGLDPVGSLAFGLGWTGIGLVGTGVAAVACQTSASTRACGGIALSVFAALFLLRAAGDVGPDLLGWLSPLGWGTRLDAWGQPRWWLLGAYLAVSVALLLLAAAWQARRDLGSGLLPERLGREHGRLSSIADLVWRLNRSVTAWWLLAATVWGALFGSVTPHLGALFESPAGRAALEAMGGEGKVQEVMLAALLAIMAALLSAYGVQVVVGAAHEENSDRTGAVLAARGARGELFTGVVVTACAGVVALVLGFAVGMSVGYGTQVGGVVATGTELVPAALAHVPAIWVVVACAVLLWAVRPTFAWAGWFLLAVFITIGELAPLLRLPGWMADLSPFQHVPTVPVEPVRWSAEAGLLGVAALLVAAAWLRYRSRDIA